MKRFKNNTIHKEIDQAIALTESLLQPESILDEAVTLKKDWRYGASQYGIPPVPVAWNLILNKRPPIDVYTYKPKIPWSKAIGYFDGKAIYINVRKLPFMTTVDIAANLIHEYAHYCGYKHGSNYKTKEKCLYSVPYFLSENVARWL